MATSLVVGGGALALEERSTFRGRPVLGLLPCLATALSGCQGVALWGNLAVFALSVAIFWRTLALGHER